MNVLRHSRWFAAVLSSASLMALLMALSMALLVTLLMTLTHSAAAAPMTAPDALIKDVSVKILANLKDAGTYYDKDPDRLYQKLDALLAPIVNYEAIAKGVMAAHYKTATDAQRKRFVGVFRLGLVKSYARAMLTYANSKMELQPSEGNAARPDHATVKMQVTASDGQVYPLEYSMAKEADGAWRIRNVIVYGINLGLQYRNLFDAAMMATSTRGNIDKVIDGWTSTATTTALSGKSAPKP